MSASSAGQSCRECRRRKGKCDSKLPVCSVCERYGRHCLYDKHSRSALTRKHLTEVEERLEQAEILLRTVFTESELEKLLSQNRSENSRTEANILGGLQPATRSYQAVPTASPTDNQHPVVSGSQQPVSLLPDQEDPLGDRTPVTNESIPYAAGDDFEWDERDADWTNNDTAIRQHMFSEADDGSMRNITDGMATLTANASNTGFLGTVSGASLLREISAQDQDGQDSSKPIESGGKPRDGSMHHLDSRSHMNSTLSGTWLRAQPTITRAIIDTLVDLYFMHYHPTFPILHETLFRQQYRTLHERPKGISHILTSLVAALGSFVSTNAQDETDVNLFNNVKSQLTIDSLEAGSLSLVQAFAMAANYLQKRNRPNSGYNYGGVALRLAISLGLHKEFRGWDAPPLKKEIRRRVWWSLCILDVGSTITYGRPLNWPQAGVEAHLPLNINEADLDMASLTPPTQLEYTTTYTYVRTQSAYHLATIPIYERLLRGPLPPASEMINMDDELIGSWKASLPSFFADTDLSFLDHHLLAHTIGRWRLRIMRIIMYRPFFLRWVQNGFPSLQAKDPDTNAVMRCLAAAKECIEITSRFWTAATHTRLAAWYVLYFLLQAVLIPVHCLRRVSSSEKVEDWIMQVRTALEVINDMISVNSNAVKCKDIIYKLCGSHLSDHGPMEKHHLMSPQFDLHSNPGSGIGSTGSWMTELDTAINNYDMSCDQLTSYHGSNAYQDGPEYTGLEGFNLSSFGLSAGAYDLDPGLLLMQ